MAFIAKVTFNRDFESTVFYFLFDKRPLVQQENENFVKQ